MIVHSMLYIPSPGLIYKNRISMEKQILIKCNVPKYCDSVESGDRCIIAALLLGVARDCKHFAVKCNVSDICHIMGHK